MIDGRYVTDDYYEEAAREECVENGIEPGSLVPDRPYAVDQDHADRTSGGGYGAERSIGAPFYFPGGPTTHWGGAGWNPWHNAGQGNKRAKLQGQGFTRDNWMWKMAQEAREREREIREAREHRLVDFSGERLTVFYEQYAGDEQASGKQGIKTDTAVTVNGSTKQEQAERRTTPLAQDETFDESQLMAGAGDVGSVVVETRAETMLRHGQSAIKLKAGVYRGMYEVRTKVGLQGRISTNEIGWVF
jgi:chromatin structure-remodeling complex protein RSC7